MPLGSWVKERKRQFTGAYTETVKFSMIPRRLLPNGCQYVNEWYTRKKSTLRFKIINTLSKDGSTNKMKLNHSL